jgi:AraC family transcriptional regulator, transcriptional activator of pobA
MLTTYQDSVTKGNIRLLWQETSFYRQFFNESIAGGQVQTGRQQRLLTIAWNTGNDQTMSIDGIDYRFPAQTILPLMVNQTFRFQQPEAVVAWQFDREFYCIIDHDQEVSCTGFLFYRSAEPLFLPLNEQEQKRFSALLVVFEEEFATRDRIQGDMLRMLLKRLIIKLTRLAKEQYGAETIPETSFDLIRQYRMLVEQQYRNQHQVAFYAEQLNKSPKTLSNVFALHGQESPLQIIHDRIGLETKRLLTFTDKSVKEIAYEMGFGEVPHFSRFFKNLYGVAPSEFKGQIEHAIKTIAA